MKTKTVELYEFDELPKGIKAKVLEHERFINVEDDFWHKFLLEEWEDKLKEQGFENPKISYSGFSSQGDGASFTCKSMDVDKFLTSQKKRGKFKNLLKALNSSGVVEVESKVERIDYHYSHEYTVRASVDIYWYATDDSVYSDKKFTEKADKEAQELEELLTETVRALSRKIYRELEQEYFYLTADEQVIDTIKANEYTFRANGEMENE